MPPAPEVPAEAEEEGDFDLVLGGEGGGTEASEPTAHHDVEGEEVHCSVCGFPMHAEWKVCPNCVSRYETSCTSCGRTLSAWWLICPWCETPKHPDHIHVGKGR